MQTECGHLFCKGCLEPVLEGPNPVCPIDKSDIVDKVKKLEG